ncbi:hypothetical protein O181_016589 [Austropuccinia psidii MF-1]|uniref:Uncharacterized protein n=1 Tax=Austropuccinia psidii MF-1 TaxID=1389203 RepID=A0A9Q3GRY9_9BASI|nr:hypothetical protein [Austropuccinia psidii MF-1]
MPYFTIFSYILRQKSLGHKNWGVPWSDWRANLINFCTPTRPLATTIAIDLIADGLRRGVSVFDRGITASGIVPGFFGWGIRSNPSTFPIIHQSIHPSTDNNQDLIGRDS